MIDDINKSYVEQEIRFHELVFEHLTLSDGFSKDDLKDLLRLIKDSLNGCIGFIPPEFENEGDLNIIEVYENYRQKFIQAADELEKCYLHDCLHYCVSRMSIDEIVKAKVYGE